MQLILVGLGGFLGAIARYSVNRLFSGAGTLGQPRVDQSTLDQSLAAASQPDFPTSTFVVNVVGSFLIGFLVVLAGSRLWLSGDVKLFLITGFLGAFTTFSAFSLETLQLFESGQHLKALANVLLNIFFCLAFVWLGALLARSISPGFG